MSLPVLSNPLARRLFMARHLLLAPPGGSGRGADLRALIGRLGFVQLDSVNTLARAHDLILFSRMGAYRPPALGRLMSRERALFEHWTHDAAVIPVEFFPHWRHVFARFEAGMREKWTRWQGEGFLDQLDDVRAHVARGPITSGELAPEEPRGGPGGWWEWHPSKAALEWLWHTGEITVARRDNFRKVYDLTERVIPPEHLSPRPSGEESLDWACREALARLGFATSGELAGFWGKRMVPPEDAKRWVAGALGRGEVEEIAVEQADGRLRRSIAFPGLSEEAAALPEAGGRMRALSPFDPMLRDRARAERLFGFFYRIEIFVPAEKRQWGYYVFPLLQGERLVGRVDMKASREKPGAAEGALEVRALWPEPGVRWGRGRQAAFMAELERLCRFAGLEEVRFAEGWLRA
ncbi:winged helix-turn-helix domain-containing protein [Pseudoroseicyclus tamaricis]|uniref:Winged helix-turn-helix domain-containing protein n=1 Tax=Pseudoroseicyclus tamaricis TaxID=2705421 RepID=A0A6B2K6P3_9RHOB|nr:crosslink repair DNA glycosylase YcaQ family protein [Pseudoroseicyclus tamaricis]NDV02586.1 winged helix-turn-helix domain-containing protein [Pseudoroseicyclus tamaricis]